MMGDSTGDQPGGGEGARRTMTDTLNVVSWNASARQLSHCTTTHPITGVPMGPAFTGLSAGDAADGPSAGVSGDRLALRRLGGCVPRPFVLQDLKILREHLDNSPGHQLQARTWLIHWALFIFFNHPDGRDGIIDMFFQEKYVSPM